jgi:hypothetical protein
MEEQKVESRNGAENYETNPTPKAGSKEAGEKAGILPNEPNCMDCTFQIRDLREAGAVSLGVDGSVDIYAAARKQMGTRVTRPSHFFTKRTQLETRNSKQDGKLPNEANSGEEESQRAKKLAGPRKCDSPTDPPTHSLTDLLPPPCRTPDDEFVTWERVEMVMDAPGGFG